MISGAELAFLVICPLLGLGSRKERAVGTTGRGLSIWPWPSPSPLQPQPCLPPLQHPQGPRPQPMGTCFLFWYPAVPACAPPPACPSPSPSWSGGILKAEQEFLLPALQWLQVWEEVNTCEWQPFPYGRSGVQAGAEVSAGAEKKTGHSVRNSLQNGVSGIWLGEDGFLSKAIGSGPRRP